jgi:protein ImuB
VVWCPDWPLVAAGVPVDVPAAVFHANRVVACSAAARAEGVRRGLRRREAQSRCPELVVLTHDPARDARAFEPVVAAVAAFAPRVEVTRPGACALATRGPSRYFGGDEVLVTRVVASVATTLPDGAPPARAGVADGPFAAGLAARRGMVVAPGESAVFLAPMAVSLLDDPELTGLLIRLGLHTIGDFAALPEADVVARFGPEGGRAHRRARGLDDRILEASLPPPDLSATVELDPPADQVETAAFAAKAMADGLCRSLAEAGLVCTCIRIESQTEYGEHLSRIWRHHRAFTPAAVAERVRWQLEGWLAQRAVCGCPAGERCPGGRACPNPAGGTSGGLSLVRLVPEEVAEDDGRQQGFWGGATAADERAARGLARLQGLLGPEAVVTAVLGGGRDPADQVRLVPWGDPRQPARPGPPVGPPQPGRPQPGPPQPGPVGSEAGGFRDGRRGMRAPAPAGTRRRTAGRSPSPTEIPTWPGRVPPPAPALLHRHPMVAEVVDGAGHVVAVSGRGLLTATPARLSLAGGRWADVADWAGPWPADERWWDPPARRRRARLQVVTTTDLAYLLGLEGGRWWVEATYD